MFSFSHERRGAMIGVSDSSGQQVFSHGAGELYSKKTVRRDIQPTFWLYLVEGLQSFLLLIYSPVETSPNLMVCF
jgi:hypothetical protein